MAFFSYMFLTFAFTIQFIISSSISSTDDGTITNKSIIELSKHRTKRYLPDSEYRIVGGQYVKDIRKYPFMVFVYRSIRVQVDSTQYTLEEGMCTGTLISKTHVITAGHCVKHCNCTLVDDDYCSECTTHNAEEYKLYFGNIVPANSRMTRTLKKVHLHPEFKKTDLTHKCMDRFDIAVLELSTPVPYGQTIKAITIPKPVTLYMDELSYTMTSSFFGTNKKCTILGWGDVAINDTRPLMTRPLKKASIPIYSCSNMAVISHPMCTDTSFCAICPQQRNAFCDGDSGGPIICGGVQLGVASSSDCKGFNTYTRIDITVQWIRSIMSNKHDRMPHEY